MKFIKNWFANRKHKSEQRRLALTLQVELEELLNGANIRYSEFKNASHYLSKLRFVHFELPDEQYKEKFSKAMSDLIDLNKCLKQYRVENAPRIHVLKYLLKAHENGEDILQAKLAYTPPPLVD